MTARTDLNAVPPLPTVSVKELVEVMAAQGDRLKRAAVERIRGRRGRGGPPPYYATAKATIRKFHATGRAAGWLAGRAADFRRDSIGATGWRRTDLIRSAALLDSYRVHFGRRILAVETAPRLGIVRVGVRVTVAPDIHAVENGARKLIRLDLGFSSPGSTTTQVVPVVLYTAAVQYGLDVMPPGAELVFVRAGIVYPAQDVTRIMDLVDRNCAEIRRFW